MDALGRENPFLASEPSLRLFSLLWQLEVWMREMVYVEFRARYAAWQEELAKAVGNWPPRSRDPDKRLTHMATPHESGISYLSLSELLRIIRADAYWPLFARYFPPRDIFVARMSEISQIRNRIAHFRDPHDTDVERTTLFMKDVDQGFWRFATAYTTHHTSPSDGPMDSVSEYFIESHDRRAVVEMQTLDGSWQYARDRMEPRVNFDLSYSVRPWFERKAGSLVGCEGLIYHARFISRLKLSADDILERTEQMHGNCIHIRLERNALEVMVPSVIGHDLVVSTLGSFLDRCIDCTSPTNPFGNAELEKLAAKWPEYVLGPSNPLGTLDSGTPCSMFALG